MAQLDFSDLIPQQQAAVPKAGVSFGDLVPQQQAGPPIQPDPAQFDAMGNPTVPAVGPAPPPQAPQPQSKAYSGSILPFSIDEQGSMKFDPNAGLLGSLWGGVKAASDLGKYAVDGGGLSQDQLAQKSFQAAGLLAPVNPAARAGDMAIPGLLKAGQDTVPGIPSALQATKQPTVATPSTQDLFAAGDAGYNAARNMNVDYSASAVNSLASGLQRDLEGKGFDAEQAPLTHNVLNKLQANEPGAVAPLSGIDSARKSLGNIAQNFNNPTDQKAASQIIGKLDDFVVQADPSTVVRGPADQAAKVISDARGDWAAGERSDQLGNLSDKAVRRAKVNNSGLNLGNTVRQRVADVLDSPAKSSGYSPDELSALTTTAEGTGPRNLVRWAGNFLGGGGGMGGVVSAGAGAAAGGPLGAMAVPAAGLLLKKIDNFATQRALNAADEMVRQRSPLYQGLLSNAAPSMADPLQRSLLMRGLLAPNPNQ